MNIYDTISITQYGNRKNGTIDVLRYPRLRIKIYLQETVKEMIKAILSKKDLTNVHEYYSCVCDLLNSSEVERLREFRHHIGTTRFQHSLNVSYYNFLLCRKLRLNARAAARAGLLHDLFFYDRKNHERVMRSHAEEHSAVALYNASQAFSITELEGDMIVNHMFPMTLRIPRHRETFIITLVDKFCACAEVLAYATRSTGKKCKIAATAAAMMFIGLISHK